MTSPDSVRSGLRRLTMNEKHSSLAGATVPRQLFPQKRNNLALDLTGETYGLWLVLYRVLPQSQFKNSNTRWMCRCKCGTERVVNSAHLRNKASKCCGCTPRAPGDRSRPGPEDSYYDMIKRCYHKHCKFYKYYGGRTDGPPITVCPQWLGPTGKATFLADSQKWKTKYREGLTLDRLDNNKNYSPDNCDWSDRTKQNRNRRSNVNITIDGVTHCAMAWSKISGVHESTIRRRLKENWPPQRAVFKPAQH